MQAAVLVLCLFGASHFLHPALARPSPPVWPTSYEVKYTISLPYVSSVQPTPLKYPVHIWYNQTASLMRLSFYEGLDDIYITPEATFNLYPRIVTRTCLVINSTVGPTVGGAAGLLGEEHEGLTPPLPDLSQWQYAGPSQLEGKVPSYAWQLTLRSQEKVATYTFHVTQREGHPVHLDMLGTNLFTGSHFDQYVVDFEIFMPLISTRAFKPPMKLCDKAARTNNKLGHGVVSQALSVLPGVMVPSSNPVMTQDQSKTSVGALLSSWWSHLTARVTQHSKDAHVWHDTTKIVADNVKFIDEWNKGGRQQLQDQLGSPLSALISSMNDGDAAEDTAAPVTPVMPQDVFRLQANKFITWSDDRWQSSMMGHVPKSSMARSKVQFKDTKRLSAQLGTFHRRLSDAELPSSVDWRGTGADGPVKDQASCGSCWSFAATGAMTGAWYVATNQTLSFSEQQLVDCSWDYQCPDDFCGGCWGGNVESALQYVHDYGGMTLEGSYPYKGQNGMCRGNQTAKSATFKGFLSVPTKDERALMEAVAVHGPVAISFDAVHPTFKYYSEGVYYREDCGQDEDHLNHAVTLVGYGTTPGGTDYWLLRNSWSQFWGDGGYFKMARKGNDCGVTVDAVIAVVDEAAVERTTNDQAATTESTATS